MSIILLTCSTALLLMGAAYVLFEYFSYQTAEKNKVSTMGLLIASNSSAALAFDSPDDAEETLSALEADKYIAAACLYTSDGKLFAKYPANLPDSELPSSPGEDGYFFKEGFVEGFQPVNEQKLHLGTLYIKSSLSGLYEKMRFNIVVAFLLIVASLVIAYIISNLLQKSISGPLISLEKTALHVSEQRDYSVRAVKAGNDELGALTDAFNHMLSQIEAQNVEIINEKQESSKLAAIVESSGDAIIGNTLDLVISSWNQSAERLLGYSEDEMLGKSVKKIIAPHRLNQVVDILAQLRNGEQIEPFETQFISKNGNLLDISLTISLVKDTDGEITGMSQIARDITEHKSNERKVIENEEHLRLATQAAELGTFDMDLVKGTMVWDRRCRELFGITGDAPVSYEEHFLKGLHEEDRERISGIVDGVFKKHVSGGNYDVEYRTKDINQRVRWVRAKGKVFFDDLDKPVRFIGSVLDVTSKKLEEQKKNDFIAIISHELKTPLTTIKSYIQLLLARAKKEGDSFGINALTRADTQTNKMSSMIKDFLSLARIEEGKIKLDKEIFELSPLLEEVVADAHQLSTNYTIELKDCGGLKVEGDKDKLGQVLINLLSNAIKYSPAESHIVLGCEEENGKVKVYVTDRGVGISESHQKQLFTRFYRVENEKVKTVSGFGVGLYIVSEILKYHNSKIMLDSKEGEGSTFYFFLDAVA